MESVLVTPSQFRSLAYIIVLAILSILTQELVD
jgi:hypothetical protein